MKINSNMFSKRTRVPRILFILSFCFLFFSTYANVVIGTYAQEKTFTVAAKNKTVKDVLNYIEKNSEFIFFYLDEAINTSRPVSISVKNETITEILDDLFRGTDVTYEIKDRQVSLKKDQPSQAQQPASKANTRKVEGFVVDASTNEPLAGVSIIVQGEQRGTVTAIDGSYSIEVSNKSELLFSFLGYEKVTVKVGSSKTLNIKMYTDDELLEEVVVVGYGTQKKANLSGAVETVTAKEIANRATNNVGLALQGLVPNLNVTMSSGGADYTPSFNIRGETSINGGEPLILVDGIPTTAADFSHMNALDIENISILKDASSAAVYGARAAFGVILVTTKKGSEGSIKINFNNSYNVRTPTRLIEVVEDPYIQADYKTVMGAPWYHLYTDEEIAYAKQRSEDPSLPTYMLSTKDKSQYTFIDANNFYKEIFENTATSHQHSLSLSGGTNKATYYLGMEYYGESGLLRYNKDEYGRYNVRSRIEYRPWNWLTVGNNTNWSYNKYERPQAFNTSWFREVYEKNCMYSIYNPDGVYTVVGAQVVGRLKDGGEHIDKTSNFNTQFTLQADIVKDIWSIKGDYSVNVMNKHSNEWNSDNGYLYKRGPELPLTHLGDGNFAMRTYDNSMYTILNLYTDFHKKWGDHTVSVVAGFNQEYKTYEYFKAKRNDLISDSYPTIQLSTGEMTMSEDAYQWAIRSGFYRLNYIFKNRYILETNGRYDGSSRFPKNHRFAFFPSVSGAWILSEESFFKPLKNVFDYVKLRGSYGSLGNQNVSYYAYIASMNAAKSGVLLNGSFPMTVSPSGLISGALTWEKVYSTNGGIDINMFNNRIALAADIYRRDTKDMLVPGKTYPSVLGTSSPKANNGDMKTKGWELSITYRDHFNLASKPFNYSATFVLSDSRSWITKYDNPNNTLSDYRVGQEIGEIWGLETEGFFIDQADVDSHADQRNVISYYDNSRKNVAGDLKYKDLDGNGKIEKGLTADDPKDFKIIGNSRSRFPYGLDFNADWNGFDLRIFVQGIGKKQWYPQNSDQKFFGIFATPYANVLKNNLDHWTEENPNAYFPRLKSYVATSGDMSINQTRYLQNAAYMRMKNITFGYTLPRQVVSKIKLSGIRFYFSGENLFEITKLCKNYDPEGLNNNSHPFQRTFSLGMNISL